MGQNTQTCLKNKCSMNNSDVLLAQLLADGCQKVNFNWGRHGNFLLFLKSFKSQPNLLLPMHTQVQSYLQANSYNDGSVPSCRLTSIYSREDKINPTHVENVSTQPLLNWAKVQTIKNIKMPISHEFAPTDYFLFVFLRANLTPLKKTKIDWIICIPIRGMEL